MNTISSDTTLRAAEWVLPGHPDKLADAVADALVQAAQQRQAEALCAIEVAVHRDQVYLTGRLACEGADQVPLRDLVREVYRSAGYGAGQGAAPAGTSQAVDPDTTLWRPAPQDLTVAGNLCVEPLVPGEERIRHISDDQSIVTGYAIDLPGIGCIPPEQWLAREVARRLFAHVHSPLRLCPDGKVLVVLQENGSEPIRWRLHAVSCSLLAQCGDIALHRAAAQAVREAAQALALRLPAFDPTFEPGTSQAFVVNGSGTFSIGGPEGDNGLSGKKLLLDHYGPRVPIGGTALSGKDFWKPDRAGTLLARRLALAVVQSGVAPEATVQFVAFPGDEAPRLVRIVTPQGELPGASRWLQLIDCRFETAAAWGRGIDLVERARWGWFGVEGPGLAWEGLGLR